MATKRSKAELKRLVESAVAEVCWLPRPGLWFCVDELEVVGAPPEHLRVWATLYFAAEGSPYCCGEPQCHLWLMGDRLSEAGDHVRRAMRLRQTVTLEFVDIAAQFHAGVRFRAFEREPDTD